MLDNTNNRGLTDFNCLTMKAVTTTTEIHINELSLCVRKPTIWVVTRSDTNQAVQSQKQARSLKFQIYEEGLYYLCSENKGADQLRG